MIRRQIKWAPGYSISQNGLVTHDDEPIAPEVRNTKYSKILTVWIHDRCYPLPWLLSQVWFGEQNIVLPRNGNPISYMDEKTSSRFAVSEAKLKRSVSAAFDFDLIAWIWELYESRKLPCSAIRSEGGLNNITESDVVWVVSKILEASIRL